MEKSSTNLLLEQMERDSAAQAEKAGTASDKLDRLAALANRMNELEKEIEERDKRTAELVADLADVSGRDIPALFEELGVEEMKLRDGSKVTVKRGFATSITKEHEAQAFGWLKQNGHESIIKHKVEVELKKDETQEHQTLIRLLNEQGVSYADKESVHASTLKAFVNEQMAVEGSTLPQDLFGVFPVNITKIKQPK